MLRSNALDQVLLFGLLLILAVPLIFGTSLLYPFVAYRTYFFYILIDCLFLLFLYRHKTDWLLFVSKNSIARLLGLFLAAKLVSDLLGGYFLFGFWGNYERMMGLMVWLHLAAYFVMVITIFHDAVKFEKLFWVTSIVGSLVSAYGILQYFNIAFKIRHIDDRLFSTVGNPAFLAGFLLFSIGFTFLFVSKKTDWQRWLFVVFGFVQMYALYLTATRGAFAGAVVGTMVGLIGYISNAEKWKSIDAKKKMTIWVSGAVILLFPIIIYLARQTDFVQSHLPLRRFATISLSDASAQTRITLAKVALHEAIKRPIFGYGENTIVHPLDFGFVPAILEGWVDSTHNIFLDIILSHGAVGLIIFLAFLWIVARSIYKVRVRCPMEANVMLGILVAYVVQGLFIFDTLVVLLPLMLVFGYALILTPMPVVNKQIKNRLLIQIVSIFVSVGTCVLLITYVRSIRSLIEITIAYRSAADSAPLSTVTEHLSQSSSLALFGFRDISITAADIAELRAKELSAGGDDVLALLDQIQSIYKLAEEREGATSLMLVDLARIYAGIPASVGPYRSQVLPLIKRARELSPGRGIGRSGGG